MVTQLDSPDGKTHKDKDRPSPAFVETDNRKSTNGSTLRPDGAAVDETRGDPQADAGRPDNASPEAPSDPRR